MLRGLIRDTIRGEINQRYNQQPQQPGYAAPAPAAAYQPGYCTCAPGYRCAECDPIFFRRGLLGDRVAYSRRARRDSRYGYGYRGPVYVTPAPAPPPPQQQQQQQQPYYDDYRGADPYYGAPSSRSVPPPGQYPPQQDRSAAAGPSTAPPAACGPQQPPAPNGGYGESNRAGERRASLDDGYLGPPPAYSDRDRRRSAEGQSRDSKK